MSRCNECGRELDHVREVIAGQKVGYWISFVNGNGDFGCVYAELPAPGFARYDSLLQFQAHLSERSGLPIVILNFKEMDPPSRVIAATN